MKLPLSWHLSQPNIKLIAHLIGNPDQCAPGQLRSTGSLYEMFHGVADKIQENLLEREGMTPSSGLKEEQIAKHSGKGDEAEEKKIIPSDIKNAANAMGELFYHMTINRCVLRQAIEDVSLTGQPQNEWQAQTQ